MPFGKQLQLSNLCARFQFLTSPFANLCNMHYMYSLQTAHWGVVMQLNSQLEKFVTMGYIA